VEAIYRKLPVLFLILLLTSPGLALTQEEAQQSLQEAQNAINSMEQLNLSTTQVEDLYVSANKSFRAQSTLENPDYSEVESKTDRIVEIKDRAIRLYDSISAFNETVQQAEAETSIDLTRVKKSYSQAVKDMKAGRYSESSEHLEEARSRLSSERSSLNRARAFYDATSNDLLSYIRQNTALIGSTAVAFITFLLISLNEYRYLRTARKVRHLERKENVVEELMRDTEKEYYVERDMDEDSFEARQRKYSEMLNHVEEKLPVYRKKTQDKKSLIKSLKHSKIFETLKE